jgi:hypothetical protein
MRSMGRRRSNPQSATWRLLRAAALLMTSADVITVYTALRAVPDSQ